MRDTTKLSLQGQEKSSRNFVICKVTTFSFLNTIMTFKEYWERCEFITEKNTFKNFDKSTNYQVGQFEFLKQYGIADGIVYIDGNIIREGRSRGRWSANNVLNRISQSLKNCQFCLNSYNHNDKNQPVVEAYCVLQTPTKTYLNKIIIDLQTHKIVSLHAISPTAFKKAKVNRVVSCK